MKKKGDFAFQPKMLVISGIAICIGVLCAVVAWVLFRLIGLVTNLMFHLRFAWDFASPADNPLGAWVILVPVVGGLIVGLMARFGTDRIRGHGIPEALEAILYGKSIMSPRVAVLKPLSSAVAIGSGGPFGAEGPIIMTGGAVGSLVATAFMLTANERRTLLVAGAAAGMAATFNTPIAAVLLSVELLLFELKPRSLVPVGLACAVAAALRPYLLGGGALFHVPAHYAVSDLGLLSAVPCGILAAALSLILTVSVYACEDAFRKLPVHWMWWPALGGLVVGIGGYFEPHALGVGYDVIRGLLNGHYLIGAALILVAVKLVIWAIALGSGTSGGVLAPLLIMGAGLGVLEGSFLPGASPLVWPLVSMGAVLAGTMRSPLTAIVFCLELTYSIDVLRPLLIACIVAHATSVLVLKRSILTEKVARHGFHIFREYNVDPMGTLFVADVMTRTVQSIPGDSSAAQVRKDYFHHETQKFRSYPVTDETGRVLGLVTRAEIVRYCVEAPERSLADWCADMKPVVATPDATCYETAGRMALERMERMPVVPEDGSGQLIGIITRSDIVNAMHRHFEDEQLAERRLDVLGINGRNRTHK
ncbi:MAG TPA: chloride channel protein [Gammaproteobacteria bacterium]|nr:chloride channel protein [Gammaproteobacteria bacterium]